MKRHRGCHMTWIIQSVSRGEFPTWKFPPPSSMMASGLWKFWQFLRKTVQSFILLQSFTIVSGEKYWLLTELSGQTDNNSVYPAILTYIAKCAWPEELITCWLSFADDSTKTKKHIFLRNKEWIFGIAWPLSVSLGLIAVETLKSFQRSSAYCCALKVKHKSWSCESYS